MEIKDRAKSLTWQERLKLKGRISLKPAAADLASFWVYVGENNHTFLWNSRWEIMLPMGFGPFMHYLKGFGNAPQ